MNKEHSQLPWKRIAATLATESNEIIFHANPETYEKPHLGALDGVKAELDFIVRACNNHDKLVAMLKETLKALEDLSFECDDVVYNTRAPSRDTYNDTFEILDKNRKAFRKIIEELK